MNYKGITQETMQNRTVPWPNIPSDAQNTVNAVVETVKNNKLLIGSIAAGCGAAIFILATDSGKRLRNQIQERAVDVYDVVSEQLKNGWSQSRDVINNMLYGTRAEQAVDRLNKAA